MTKQVITDLDEARKLAEAGLLWYYSPGFDRDTPVDWKPSAIDHTDKHWQFYLLLEE